MTDLSRACRIVALAGLSIAFPTAAFLALARSEAHDSVLAENGRHPAPAVKEIAGRGVDLRWDGRGWTNTWHQPGATRFPLFLPDPSWPDVFRRAWSRVVSGLARMLG